MFCLLLSALRILVLYIRAVIDICEDIFSANFSVVVPVSIIIMSLSLTSLAAAFPILIFSFSCFMVSVSIS